MTVPNTIDIEQAKLNAETALMPWQDLQRFFAQGAVLQIAAHLDLIEVAAQMGADNVALIKTWFEAGDVARVSDAQAVQWASNNTELWTVVVKPFILVQDRTIGTAGVAH